MPRLFVFCRSHFFKLLFVLVASVMVLQYGLSTIVYGPKRYLLNFSVLSLSGGASGDRGTLLNNNGDAGGSTTAASVNVTSSAHFLYSNNEITPPHNSNNNNNGNNASFVKNITGFKNGSDVAGHSRTLTGAIINGTNINVTSKAQPTESAKLPICPAIPPKLVGPVKVLSDPPSLKELENMHPELEPGGRFKPKDCQARHRVAIIIPYRDRELHLRLFLYNMHPILQRQQLDYGIIIVEQIKDTKFNRATLMNIGFKEALNLSDYQCAIFHDVDLLPEDDRNIYSCPESPRHMSVAIDVMNYKLPYADIFGGVGALTVEQMKKVNGFSNEFWGWGGEDDDMANRIKYHGYKVSRYPDNIARYKMMKHTKDKPNPDRYNKLNKGKQRFKTDGLNNLKYKRVDLKKLKLYTWLLVELENAPKF